MAAEEDDTPDCRAVRPLTFFFPEISEAEARTLDTETALIMERRVRVMALYRRGRPMRAIADELRCSVGTVHHDVHCVLDGFMRLAARTAQEHVADMLQQLAHREADIEEQWERSKGDAVETSTGKRDGRAAGSEARVRKRQRHGDPRLAALLIAIWDRRCKLLGLFKPDAGRVETFRPLVVGGEARPEDL